MEQEEIVQRVIRMEGDIKDLKERTGRHSGRINTLEQEMLQEKGELSAVKGELKVINKTQKETNVKVDKLGLEVQEMKTSFNKFFIKMCILMGVVLGILFVKDSSSLTTILHAIGAISTTVI